MKDFLTRRNTPLADRLRPSRLDDVLGHAQVLGPESVLRQWIAADRVPSLLLWGPPGCGKTTLAKLIGSATQKQFVELHAADTGVSETREVLRNAEKRLEQGFSGTIVFMDEVHRLTRNQQESWFAAIESGLVVWMGATTENPSAELAPALLSRLRVFRLEALTHAEVATLLTRALGSRENGLKGLWTLSDEAKIAIAQVSGSDGRRSLQLLEILTDLWAQQGRTGIQDDKTVQEDLKRLAETHLLRFDRKGEDHYNLISAFIKSMRASDSDAAIYYLARMIRGGEDPVFIARRMVVFASEDIGSAHPSSLALALAVKNAVEFLGMPEARIALSQGVIALAKAPKDRTAYDTIEKALALVDKTGPLEVPMHLRNATNAWVKNFGYGRKAPNDAGNLPLDLKLPTKPQDDGPETSPD